MALPSFELRSTILTYVKADATALELRHKRPVIEIVSQDDLIVENYLALKTDT
jgi:hypothetical protein